MKNRITVVGRLSADSLATPVRPSGQIARLAHAGGSVGARSPRSVREWRRGCRRQSRRLDATVPNGWVWGKVGECARHDERGRLSPMRSDADWMVVARRRGDDVSRWRRSGAPRQSASSPTPSGRKGDREGHTDLAIEHSEVGLTEKGERRRWAHRKGGKAAAAQNPSRNRWLRRPHSDKRASGRGAWWIVRGP
jgi:hypothetical protein